MAKMEGRWVAFHSFRRFGDYVEYLRRVDHGWGDDLTLQLMAEMFVRPIHIINDHVLESPAYVTKNLPAFIAEKCWRPAIVVAHCTQHQVIDNSPSFVCLVWFGCGNELVWVFLKCLDGGGDHHPPIPSCEVHTGSFFLSFKAESRHTLMLCYLEKHYEAGVPLDLDV